MVCQVHNCPESSFWSVRILKAASLMRLKVSVFDVAAMPRFWSEWVNMSFPFSRTPWQTL